MNCSLKTIGICRRQLDFNQTELYVGGRYSSVVSSAPTICNRAFKSQANHLFSICINKIVLDNDENKRKEAGIGPFLKKLSLTLA